MFLTKSDSPYPSRWTHRQESKEMRRRSILSKLIFREFYYQNCVFLTHNLSTYETPLLTPPRPQPARARWQRPSHPPSMMAPPPPRPCRRFPAIAAWRGLCDCRWADDPGNGAPPSCSPHLPALVGAKACRHTVAQAVVKPASGGRHGRPRSGGVMCELCSKSGRAVEVDTQPWEAWTPRRLSGRVQSKKKRK